MKGGEKMKYYPIHVTHIVVSTVWASALITINAIEFLFFKSMTDTGLFFIVLQNIGIGLGNAYWLAKTHITPRGLDITTSK